MPSNMDEFHKHQVEKKNARKLGDKYYMIKFQDRQN